jgi:membrane-bound lytic murein transglycosylase MltF
MNKKVLKILVLFFAMMFSFVTSNIVNAEVDQSILEFNEKWTGDYDGMVERHVIRALVPYSKTFYFLDGGDQRGLTYESLLGFDKYINKKLKKNTMKVRLVVIPTSRDRLLPGLVEGLGDIAAGNLTITPERQKLVDFTDPGYKDVSEIIVTGPKAPSIKTIEDLSGKKIHVRKSSSYYESLILLNARFKKEGKKPVKLVLTDEYLEDEDLLEMMNAGLIPMIVIDSHKGTFWKQIFKEITLHPDITVRNGGQIAWAIRKNSPELKKAINGFVKTYRKGTLMGNILFKRYLENTKWVKNSLNDEDMERLRQAVKFFKKYGKQYKFDWLMIAALAYQESRIDQSKRSPVGAIGVMQVLPSTAKDKNINIPGIEQKEDNIHAGVKYLRFLRDRYFEDQPMDDLNKMLFSFASYNAGPAKVSSLRKEARKRGLDPNIWFRNVEVIASKRIGRETVQYVGNIYKYYIAYSLSVDILEKR